MRLRRLVLAVALLAAGLATIPFPGDAATPSIGEAGPLQHWIGSLHEHSGYSDGWPGSRPDTFYRSGKTFGLDFMGGSDHSDTLNLPITASDYCLDPTALAGCVPGDQTNPTDGLDKWEATLRQARAVSDASYTAFRGFEWTSDRFGHINVYFSKNQANAKVDGGYADMAAFYQWFGRRAEVGGGADGLATFNHPGAKQLHDSDPTQNWNDFAYEPAADDRMVGIEVFNDTDEYGSAGPAEGWFVHALDKGWHLGAVGAEDLGHRKEDDWGGPGWAKTVMIAPDRSEASLRGAMLARRFYAVRTDDGLRLDLTIDGALMGSRLTRSPGAPLQISAAVNHPGLTLELVTSGGRVITTSVGTTLGEVRGAGANEPYYFLRVRDGDRPVAYSSPIWVSATAVPPTAEWLAGDLHVHTCLSHDGYCGPDDDNTGPEDFYTLSGTIEERFAEAAVKGLDYLAITDHNDVRSQSDPSFGAHGVIPVAGYEHSFSGHGQMLGADHVHPSGDGSPGVQAAADALRADGGVFQINHPADSLIDPMDTCDETGNLDWSYGYDVVPDTLEVWNIGHLLQPPAPAGNSNDDAERFWECFLDAGHHVAATGGSDSHWLSTSAVQGVGNPTTWVLSDDRSQRGVLAALRNGRTSISMLPPLEGGAPLLLEGDENGDGTFEAVIGDEVLPGTAMRVRSLSPLATGLVRIRANSTTIVEDEPLVPGGEVRFTAPADEGWVRASLRQVVAPAPLAEQCTALALTSYCRNQLVVSGLTSPIYLAAPLPAGAADLLRSAALGAAARW